MKDPVRRTKVVIRHLPPSLSQSDLLSSIEDRFSNRFTWFSFRLGKSSYKRQRYSRAYIDFKTPEDVFEFAEFFDGHVFVNEKGTQFKAVVEYAPSQRVPKPGNKKDVREGTILKDPDYLEFLKMIAKPVENLPSAEIQLEKKEAELSGTPKEAPIVTPLMEFVRQKRNAESGMQGSLPIGKISRRAGGASTSKSSSSSSKRSSEKKKYILKDGAKSSSRKDRSKFVVVSRREDQVATSAAKGATENETVCSIDGSPVMGVHLTADSGKKKILLLKPKDRETTHVPEGASRQQGSASANSPASAPSRQNQRREAGGRLIRSILMHNETCQNQSSAAVQPQKKTQATSLDNVKRPPRTGSASEKHEKRVKSKDRPDRGVWTPMRRSDVSQASEERSSTAASQLPDSVEATQVDIKNDMIHGSSGRNVPPVENGSHRPFNRRVAAHVMKDDGSVNLTEGKSSKRGGPGGGSHEKQMWVQKPSGP